MSHLGRYGAGLCVATGMLRGLQERAEQTRTASGPARLSAGHQRPGGSTARARLRSASPGPARYFADHPLPYGLSLAGSGGTALYALAVAARSGQRRRLMWLALCALCAAQFAGIVVATELTRRRAWAGRRS